MSSKSRFVIVNDCDAPIRANVAEWVEGLGYCYNSRSEDKDRKKYDGMNPRNPTPIEHFGFAVRVYAGSVTFHRVCESYAGYEDGSIRQWQEGRSEVEFRLPLVTGVKIPRQGKA